MTRTLITLAMATVLLLGLASTAAGVSRIEWINQELYPDASSEATFAAPIDGSPEAGAMDLHQSASAALVTVTPSRLQMLNESLYPDYPDGIEWVDLLCDGVAPCLALSGQ